MTTITDRQRQYLADLITERTEDAADYDEGSQPREIMRTMYGSQLFTGGIKLHGDDTELDETTLIDDALDAAVTGYRAWVAEIQATDLDSLTKEAASKLIDEAKSKRVVNFIPGYLTPEERLARRMAKHR